MELFPDIFWKNQNKGTLQEIRKKKFKIVCEKFQHRAGLICSKLDSTLVFEANSAAAWLAETIYALIFQNLTQCATIIDNVLLNAKHSSTLLAR